MFLSSGFEVVKGGSSPLKQKANPKVCWNHSDWLHHSRITSTVRIRIRVRSTGLADRPVTVRCGSRPAIARLPGALPADKTVSSAAADAFTGYIHGFSKSRCLETGPSTIKEMCYPCSIGGHCHAEGGPVVITEVTAALGHQQRKTATHALLRHGTQALSQRYRTIITRSTALPSKTWNASSLSAT